MENALYYECFNFSTASTTTTIFYSVFYSVFCLIFAHELHMRELIKLSFYLQFSLKINQENY